MYGDATIGLLVLNHIANGDYFHTKQIYYTNYQLISQQCMHDCIIMRAQKF